MPITRTAWIDDDGSGTTGTVINNAEKTLIYDQIDAHTPAWVDIPFNAANFVGASGGTWAVTSGGLATHAHQTINSRSKLYWLTLTGGGCTVTGAPVFLNVTLPFTIGKTIGGSFHYYGPVVGTGVFDGGIFGTTLSLLRDIGGTAWAAGAYNIRLVAAIPLA